MERKVVADGGIKPGGRRGACRVRHVAVLATADRGQISPESPAHVDGGLGEGTHGPLTEGPLQGKLVQLVVRWMGRIQCVQDVGVRGRGDGPSHPQEGWVGHFVASRAEEGILMERGFLPRMPWEGCSQIEGTAPPVQRVENVLAPVRVVGGHGKPSKNAGVGSRIGSVGDGVHHAMTGMAIHSVVIMPRKGAPIRWRAAAFDPTPWRMAADAHASGKGHVLFGDGHGGVEDRVAHGLSHHSARPIGIGFHRGVVPPVAGKAVEAGEKGVHQRMRLASGLFKIPFGGSGGGSEEKPHHAGGGGQKGRHRPD